MAASQNALSAKGILLKIGDGASPTQAFTTIAELKDIGGPSLEQEPIDVTNHSSGTFKEFVGGLNDAGEVTFDINFIPTEATHKDAAGGLLNDLKTQTCRDFELIWPDSGNTKWSFSALVTGFEPSGPVDGALTASITLKLVGEPTLA